MLTYLIKVIIVSIRINANGSLILSYLIQINFIILKISFNFENKFY